MIERLLPSEASAAAMRGDAIGVRPFPEEEALLGEAVESRRAEFAAARHCARQALRRLGIADGPILRGPKREPLWPPGIVGSITHCTGYRAAAVARAADMLAIGIDAEPHAAIPDRVARRVLVAAETAWAAAAPRDIHWDRLIFSAKESVYKAWYPLAGRWLGFEDACVTIDPAARAFQARLLIEPPPGVPRIFEGRYLVADGLVVTAIAAPHQA
ncbi:MAG TPA: 4'-phosphopantetheinyl transferase superfamily protein [Stellaceae bacterium]|nr:4'-phosphopantetheinyl transferase superfamily protein [Stellaceae bacterium]